MLFCNENFRKRFFNDDKSKADDIFKMFDHIEATRYLE
jgi:hypothetical protein